MKTRTFWSALPVIALVTAIAVITVAWQAQRVQAIQDSEDFPSDFGSIQLSAGQTASLNVILTRSNDVPGDDRLARRLRLAFDVYIQDEENTPNCGGIIPMPTCLTRYRFLRRESRDVELMPGEGASLDLTAVQGAKVAASIHMLGGPDTRPESRGARRLTVVPSLEVREATRTLFVVPAVVKGFNPQPDPPGQQL